MDSHLGQIVRFRKTAIAFKNKRGRIARWERIVGFATKPHRAFPRKISRAYVWGEIGIFVGNTIGGIRTNPLSPFSRKISVASEENATEISAAIGLGSCDAKPLSPFSRNVAIAFTEKRGRAVRRKKTARRRDEAT